MIGIAVGVGLGGLVILLVSVSCALVLIARLLRRQRMRVINIGEYGRVEDASLIRTLSTGPNSVHIEGLHCI